MSSTLGYEDVFFPVVVTTSIYVGCRLIFTLFKWWTSPLNILPGPKSSSIIFGNMIEIRNAGAMVMREEWTEKYSSTIKYSGYLGVRQLYTTDVKAINHILMNDYTYQKPERRRYGLAQIVGEGVLVVEGEKHKQQRKIMVINATHNRVVSLVVPVESSVWCSANWRADRNFMEKAIGLRDAWSAEIKKVGSHGQVEVLSWLSKMTLDVIGLAGFNYQFDALKGNEDDNELSKAFSTVFKTSTKLKA